MLHSIRPLRRRLLAWIPLLAKKFRIARQAGSAHADPLTAVPRTTVTFASKLLAQVPLLHGPTRSRANEREGEREKDRDDLREPHR